MKTDKNSTTKTIYLLLLSLILPNIAQLLAAWFSGAERSIFNVDYIIPLILLSLGHKTFGILSFILFYFIDCFMLTLQFFPFVNISDIIYLSSFILFGQTLYIIIVYVTIAVAALKSLVIRDIAKKAKPIEIFKIYIILLILAVLSTIPLKPIKELQLEKYAQSYTVFLLKHHNDSFFNLIGNQKVLVKSPFSSASQPWHTLIQNKKQPNHRLLLVVDESWGMAADPKVQDAILSQLKSKSNYFDFFSEGHFFFSGATVNGEIRELCNLKAQSLDMTLVNTADFSPCLPTQLKKLGYETYALHGATADMYARRDWYPRIGFDHLTFFDTHSWPRKCHAFDGACDVDLPPLIAETFAQKNNIFYYWLTLNSHADYDKRDIFSNRIDCNALEIDPTSESCRIIKLHAQFFDALSELMINPNMKDVEVIVVGDHPPPFFELRQNINTFQQGQIAWIHFKTK